MDNFYVYMYLRSKRSRHGESGTPYYVGKGRAMRAYSKYHRVRPPVDKSMIVFVVQNLSESTAHEEEKRLIALYGRIDNGTGCLRNLTDGGEGQCGAKWSSEIVGKRASKNRGRKRSEEFCRKNSSRQKGKPKPPHVQERLRKFAASMKGQKLSAEHVAKIAASNTGKKRDPRSAEWRELLSASRIGKNLGHHFGFNNTSFKPGHKHSEKTILKIRSAKLGTHHSEETRARMSVSSNHIGGRMPGFNHSLETKEKMRNSALGRIARSMEA